MVKHVVVNSSRQNGKVGNETLPSDADQVLMKLARISRALYESLQALGLDKEIEASLSLVPDLNDRLSYINQVLCTAATDTLDAVDLARPLQESLAAESVVLSARWEQCFDRPAIQTELSALMRDTRSHVQAISVGSDYTQIQLTRVLMAQSFQDLTGQVLRRVSELVTNLECQLADLLAERISSERRAKFAALISSQRSSEKEHIVARADLPTVNTQADVDDLLASMGF